MKNTLILLLSLALSGMTGQVIGQSITVYPQQTLGNTSSLYDPGVFLVPKTTNGENDFLNNGIHFNSIRLISIETAFDFSSPSINDIMATLELLKPGIMYVNSRCDRLVLPIMKMPAWLSSSNDTTTIGGGWKVFNAMPPSNYNTWNILMDSIVNKINGQWGLDPFYEIWNEPDIFYWQGTDAQYFSFFRSTFNAIKANHPSAKVGGPVVSSFTSKFGSAYLPGFISNTEMDTSIIGRLIDSCMAWNVRMDFISWHKFDSYLFPMKMEMDYLNQKLVNSGHGIVPYLISEWNNSSGLRESNFSATFMPNYVLAAEHHNINAHLVAAWQDFDMGTDEFHSDYGMISWGALHKPEWKSLLLLDKMEGVKVYTDTSDYLDLAAVSAVQSDTLRVLFSNHALPGYVVATSSLMYDNQFNALDLALGGYSGLRLDSIYQGLITISGTDSLSTAINAVIPIYQEADSAFRFGRNIDLTISGLQGVYQGKKYVVDSTANNVVFRYDSLIASGFTRTSAVSFLYPNDTINYSSVSITDSVLSFHMNPNSAVLLEFIIPGISGTIESPETAQSLKVYPNPNNGTLTIEQMQINSASESVNIYNSLGALVKTINLMNSATMVDIADLPDGIYLFILNSSGKSVKVIKQ